MRLAVSCICLLATSHAFASDARATLRDAAGKSVGEAEFSDAKPGVRVVVTLRGLAPGKHMMHLHENGRCEPPKFESAGVHFDPQGNAHHGSHHGARTPAGDLPDVDVGADGSGRLTVVLSAVTLGSGPDSLLKPGGTALMVHAGSTAGLSTMPGIEAKVRIACGVVEKK